MIVRFDGSKVESNKMMQKMEDVVNIGTYLAPNCTCVYHHIV